MVDKRKHPSRRAEDKAKWRVSTLKTVAVYLGAALAGLHAYGSVDEFLFNRDYEFTDFKIELYRKLDSLDKKLDLILEHKGAH